MRLGVLSLAMLAMVDSAAVANTCGGVTGSDPVAATQSFSAGALVIPMDSCYNPDQSGNTGPKNVGGSCGAGASYTCYAKYSSGNIRHPFGMLYLLAENNIPVSIILNQTKTSLDDADFSVTPPAGSTSPNTVTYIKENGSGTYAAVAAASGVDCGTNTVYYGGMPFVIDGSYAAQAVQVIQSFNAAHSDEFGDVPMHIINYPFSAPILGTIESLPKPVLIDASPLDTFFDESGIPDTTASGTTYIMMNGTYTYNWPASLGSNGVCTSCSTLYDSSGNNLVDVIWSTNQSGNWKYHGNLNNWSAIPGFFNNGGTVLAIDSGQTWESGSGGTFGGGITQLSKSDMGGSFCTAVVQKTSSGSLAKPGPTTEYPASNRFLQLSDLAFVIHGNGGGADGTSMWGFSSNPTAPGVEGLSDGNSNGYAAVAGHPMVNGTQSAGNLVYLGSLNSWHGGSTNKDGGLHIMYNTLIAGNGCDTSKFTDTELSRSTAVASYSSSSAKVAEYLGTFDWKIPKTSSALGNQLYVPDQTSYPYTTGHFREYKQSGTFTVSSSTDYKNCSSSNALSACNWDAATLMKPFASRSIYVVKNGTMVAASSLTGSDNTIKYLSTHLDASTTLGKLGGVDYGTPAIIEGLPNGLVTVANAKTRPTIAYIGARDGMLHAFCVQGSSGPNSPCYGKNPGEEIWAVILPGMKTVLDAAYNGGSNMDWSKVNVGGLIRVADLKDNFEGSTGVYRTVLLVGTHDTGYLDALDISDPDPANLNKAGFSFLWEQDGSTKVGGSTQEPMGKTWGGTFALTGSSNEGAAVIATAANCYGMGLTNCTTTSPGENVYVIRMADGLIVNTDARLYSRTAILFGSAIPNDVPAPATTLDADGDSEGFVETVLVPTLEGYVYRYTLKSASTTPTLATLDTTKTLKVFDASGSNCSSSSVACQPIGAPISIVRNTKGSTFGAVVVTGGSDWSRTPASSQVQHIYAFDPASTAAATAYASASLPSITPPVSSAPGSVSGLTGVAMALRGYAQLTISGTDLYADLTTISINTTSSLVQPDITPGTYGTVLRYSNINDNTAALASSAYAVAQGATFAGGAGATFTFSNSKNTESLFAADVTGASSQSMQAAPTSSTPTSSYAVSQSSGNSTFTVQTWFDGN